MIRNGIVTDWEGIGVALEVLTPSGEGFSINNAPESRVHDVIVASCGAGFVLARDTLVERCKAQNNAGDGIVGRERMLIRECDATQNQFGIAASTGSLIERATSIDNSANGFGVVMTTMRWCTARGNGGVGIDVLNGDTHIIESSISDNGRGVTLARNGRLDRCSITQNLGYGVRVSFGSIVTECDIADNQGNGVESGNLQLVASRILIRGCTIVDNSGYGIELMGAAGARVYQNMLQTNVLGAFFGIGDDSVPVSNNPMIAEPWVNIAQ